MNTLYDKLEIVADIIATEKPDLHFFGLVHRLEAPDRWDLLVSAGQLEPWTLKSLNYVVGRLRKVLTDEEMVRIARVVAMPKDNEVIRWLSHTDQVQPRKLSILNDDRFDRVWVIRREGSVRDAVAQRAGA